MKSPAKLQSKLVQLLRGVPALNVLPNHTQHWDDLELDEVAWIVEDFVNQNNEVIEADPLKEWVEEYKFYRAGRKDG